MTTLRDSCLSWYRLVFSLKGKTYVRYIEALNRHGAKVIMLSRIAILRETDIQKVEKVNQTLDFHLVQTDGEPRYYLALNPEHAHILYNFDKRSNKIIQQYVGR